MTDAMLPCVRAPLTVRERPRLLRIEVLLAGRIIANAGFIRDVRGATSTEILMNGHIQMVMSWDPDLRLFKHTDSSGRQLHSQEVVDAVGMVPRSDTWTYVGGLVGIAKDEKRQVCGIECQVLELMDQHRHARGESWVSLEEGLVLFERALDSRGQERVWQVTSFSALDPQKLEIGNFGHGGDPPCQHD